MEVLGGFSVCACTIDEEELENEDLEDTEVVTLTAGDGFFSLSCDFSTCTDDDDKAVVVVTEIVL